MNKISSLVQFIKCQRSEIYMDLMSFFPHLVVFSVIVLFLYCGVRTAPQFWRYLCVVQAVLTELKERRPSFSLYFMGWVVCLYLTLTHCMYILQYHRQKHTNTVLYEISSGKSQSQHTLVFVHGSRDMSVWVHVRRVVRAEKRRYI